MKTNEERQQEIRAWLVKSADHLASMMQMLEMNEAKSNGTNIKFEVDLPNIGMTDLTETLNVLLALEANRK